MGNETKASEIPTLPAPDEENPGVLPVIPLQSDVRRMVKLAEEAVDTPYDAIARSGISPPRKQSKQG